MFGTGHKLERAEMALRTALAERDDFRRERDMARSESAKYLRERDIAIGERDEYLGQRDVALGERYEFQRQLNVLLSKLESDAPASGREPRGK